MAGLSRTKGKAGEREAVRLLVEITGLDVRRKVRQHDGDSDVEGLPGWCVEVKRDNGMSVAAMWEQAQRQCRGSDRALLLYRRDRQPWTARWEIAEGWVESTPAVWWAWAKANGNVAEVA